jgi:hypothetical protein
MSVIINPFHLQVRSHFREVCTTSRFPVSRSVTVKKAVFGVWWLCAWWWLSQAVTKTQVGKNKCERSSRTGQKGTRETGYDFVYSSGRNPGINGDLWVTIKIPIKHTRSKDRNTVDWCHGQPSGKPPKPILCGVERNSCGETLLWAFEGGLQVVFKGFCFGLSHFYLGSCKSIWCCFAYHPKTCVHMKQSDCTRITSEVVPVKWCSLST